MIPIKTLHKEEALVIQYQTTKCPKAFGELYELFYAPLFDYTCKIVNNADDAFDITQESFIKVAQEIDKLRQPITFRFWLFRIAKHMCMHHYRKSLKIVCDQYDLDITEQNYDTSESVEKETSLIKLAETMNQLNQEDQYLLIAKYSEGKSVKELMDHTKLGSSAIKMKLMRARQKIQVGMR